VPRTAESKRARCVRKTATFPSGTPRVASSALCSISKCPARLFLAFSSPFPRLLLFRSMSRATCALSRRHPRHPRSHYFFPCCSIRLPHSPLRRRSTERCVRLNIDYARFETRVMREAPARVSSTHARACCNVSEEKTVNSAAKQGWRERVNDEGGRYRTNRKELSRYAGGTIRRREWQAYGRVQKAICCL